MSNVTKTRLELAKKAIKIRKQIDILNSEFEDVLEDMLETSGGESFTTDVPGKGSVMVVRATEGGVPQGVFTPVFNVEAYNKLSEPRKKVLAKDKVVVMKEKISSSRKPSIRIKFNA